MRRIEVEQRTCVVLQIAVQLVDFCGREVNLRRVKHDQIGSLRNILPHQVHGLHLVIALGDDIIILIQLALVVSRQKHNLR